MQFTFRIKHKMTLVLVNKELFGDPEELQKSILNISKHYQVNRETMLVATRIHFATLLPTTLRESFLEMLKSSKSMRRSFSPQLSTNMPNHIVV